ncbi:DEBR0S1_21286g1_1 [Brettanomyces bruxellensis]|uniref:COX assembly mitochondrial protein n=1 Tax=Dekkera bruxellensis TaxID=5007 RepID=A0A3F2Y1U2_DEKBR|nr:DEBR0S1_21286g1_1 [Brettanomyces bruxellensis]
MPSSEKKVPKQDDSQLFPEVDENNFMACSSLMRALDECQKKGFINKALGRCSSLRQELNMCLDQTTQARRRRKIIRKKAERKKFEEKKKKMFEEEYGKDGYLKKVIEKEYEMKHGKKPDGTPTSNE